MTVYARPGASTGLMSFEGRYENFIGGQWVAPAGGRYFENPSPVTGETFCEIARSTDADIEKALDAAHAAAPGWGKTSVAQRAVILNKIADRIEENLENIALAESWDNGKPIRETLNADIPLAIDHFRYFAGAIRAQVAGHLTAGVGDRVVAVAALSLADLDRLAVVLTALPRALSIERRSLAAPTRWGALEIGDERRRRRATGADGDTGDLEALDRAASLAGELHADRILVVGGAKDPEPTACLAVVECLHGIADPLLAAYEGVDGQNAVRGRIEIERLALHQRGGSIAWEQHRCRRTGSGQLKRPQIREPLWRERSEAPFRAVEKMAAFE